MPLIEAQPDALARLYANSLFALADERGGQEAIESTGAELGEVIEMARADRRFNEFLSSRILPTVKREASLRAIFAGNVSDLTLNFLLVLNAKERLGHVAVIAAAYDELVQERFARVEVDVYTATPIDKAMLDRIGETIRRTMHKEPVLHPYVDTSVIGGMRLQVGDRQIDGSLSTRLRRMRERFAESGSAELRVRLERIIEEGTERA
ncbi:MAG: ATP synthase F1 subunit delta [Phycisphaerales bacterium]|nr:MAG: ATP synthase F1 subunit delta [Phycisphaerales bacterium]